VSAVQSTQLISKGIRTCRMQVRQASGLRACWAWQARSQSTETICTVARWSRRKVFAASSSAAVGADPTCQCDSWMLQFCDDGCVEYVQGPISRSKGGQHGD